eukprot:TRINITY_DN2399_c0_g1_i5.p1 TRINITY_DN2399_c0_g1~~TRINITY_DN2399_c0_g1_i5.p1  ORF type:complete len:349 (+),score=37.54 TRINITY_DN2399_c0_g1_i5:98-1144(+)
MGKKFKAKIWNVDPVKGTMNGRSSSKQAAESAKNRGMTRIRNYIEEIVEMRRGKVRVKTVEELKDYFTCHICHALLEKKYLAHCTERVCSRYFCLRCLNTKFKCTEDDIYEILTSLSWDCFSCVGVCDCKLCRTKKLKESGQELPDLTSLRRRRSSVDEGMKERTKGKAGKAKEEPKALLDKRKRDPKFEMVVSLGRPFESNGTSPSPTSAAKRDSKSLKRPHDEESPSKSSHSSNEESKDEAVARNLRCHYCSKSLTPRKYAKCSLRKCKEIYCLGCIKKYFNKDFTMEQYKPDAWICFSCGESCSCPNCKEMRRDVKTVGRPRRKTTKRPVAVSYTHLTLPTIYSV